MENIEHWPTPLLHGEIFSNATLYPTDESKKVQTQGMLHECYHNPDTPYAQASQQAWQQQSSVKQCRKR
jgi:hypothetical protein